MAESASPIRIVPQTVLSIHCVYCRIAKTTAITAQRHHFVDNQNVELLANDSVSEALWYHADTRPVHRTSSRSCVCNQGSFVDVGWNWFPLRHRFDVVRPEIEEVSANPLASTSGIILDSVFVSCRLSSSCSSRGAHTLAPWPPIVSLLLASRRRTVPGCMVANSIHTHYTFRLVFRIKDRPELNRPRQ